MASDDVNAIDKWMKKRKLSQTDLRFELAKIGVEASESQVSRYCNNLSQPPLPMLKAIGHVLRVKLENLIVVDYGKKEA